MVLSLSMVECVSFGLNNLYDLYNLRNDVFLDTESINAMKKHMLRQVPGYDLLLLPPFDTQHMNHRNSMDHLVHMLLKKKRISTYKKFFFDESRLVLYLVCLQWVQLHSTNRKI